MKYLMFSLKERKYLIEIDKVNSIVKKNREDIRSLPEAPSWILGLSNLRQKIILMIDLRKRLRLPATITEEFYVVMVRSEDDIAGMVVDEVNGVISINEELKKPNTIIDVEYIKGILLKDDDIYILIDPDKIFDFDIKQFTQIKETVI